MTATAAAWSGPSYRASSPASWCPGRSAGSSPAPPDGAPSTPPQQPSTFSGVLVAVVLLDIVVQGVNILNGNRLFALSRQARSRLNTAFVTSNFIGGAIGSAAASLLWSHGGWTAVTIAGASLSCFALAVWAAGRRGPLVVAKPQ